MQVYLELYASLMRYLPPGSTRHRATLEVSDSVTVNELLSQFSLPAEECHLVVVNGVFVLPGQRGTQTLQEGDVLAVWPPVAGG